MSTTASLFTRTSFAPRPAVPALAPDLLALELIHRAQLRDLARLTELMVGQAARRIPCPPRRARAITRYLVQLADSVQHHHEVQDDIVWPVAELRAGPQAASGRFATEHHTISLRLSKLRILAQNWAEQPDDDAATALALCLAALRDLVEAHTASELEVLLPLIREHLSAGDWDAVEARIARAPGSRAWFDLPRAEAVATDEELKRLRRKAGPVLASVAGAFRVPFHRHERLVFTA